MWVNYCKIYIYFIIINNFVFLTTVTKLFVLSVCVLGEEADFYAQAVQRVQDGHLQG